MRTRQMVMAMLVGCLFTGIAFAAEERVAIGLPDGMQGFLGMVQGKLTEKGESGFVIQVEKVVKTWERNKAPDAAACIGQQIHFRVNPEQKHIIEQMAALKAGDSVVAGGAHREGDTLQAVEVLVKAADWPALQAKWDAAARQRKDRETRAPDGQDKIRQLERQNEELRKQNEELRRKLEARSE